MLFEGKEVAGIRLRTKKLRGVISQGLALPLNTFKDIKIPNEVGFDCSELLNVIKWEAPIPACLAGNVEGAFPSWFPRTDEERLQNLPEYLETFKGKSFYESEKADGTSSSYFKYQGNFGVCGRNWQLKETEGNTYWEVAKKYDLVNKLPEGYCLQGEILGEGIQKNKYKIKGHDIYVFYVYDIAKARYLSLSEMESFVKELGMKTVPIIERNFILNLTMAEMLNKANGRSLLADTRREGLVFRLNEEGNKVSFKVISTEFLLKEEE
jgi:RNA ligase (TIGR02306 family)